MKRSGFRLLPLLFLLPLVQRLMSIRIVLNRFSSPCARHTGTVTLCAFDLITNMKIMLKSRRKKSLRSAVHSFIEYLFALIFRVGHRILGFSIFLTSSSIPIEYSEICETFRWLPFLPPHFATSTFCALFIRSFASFVRPFVRLADACAILAHKLHQGRVEILNRIVWTSGLAPN